MPEAVCLINETNYLFPSCAKVGGGEGGGGGGGCVAGDPFSSGLAPFLGGGGGARAQRRIRSGRAL